MFFTIETIVSSSRQYFWSQGAFLRSGGDRLQAEIDFSIREKIAGEAPAIFVATKQITPKENYNGSNGCELRSWDNDLSSPAMPPYFDDNQIAGGVGGMRIRVVTVEEEAINLNAAWFSIAIVSPPFVDRGAAGVNEIAAGPTGVLLRKTEVVIVEIAPLGSHAGFTDFIGAAYFSDFHAHLQQANDKNRVPLSRAGAVCAMMGPHQFVIRNS
jgi:hypothetical protein